MRKHLTYIFLIIFAVTAQAQQDTFFEEPYLLSDQINSKAEEVMPLYLGDKLYFVRAFYDKNIGGKMSGHDIWVAYQEWNGEWRKPNNFFINLNNDGSNAVVGVSTDEKRIYLLNIYNGRDISRPGLSVSSKQVNGWSDAKAVNVPGLDPGERIYGIYVAPSEKVLFVSMDKDDDTSKENLYVSVRNGEQWGELQELTSLNTDGFEISPFLSPDESTLYFASNRPGGQGGSDIYMATKGSSWTDWKEPKNLGERINSDAFDAYFSMSNDSIVHFTSTRDSEKSDIWESQLVSRVDVKEIEGGDDDLPLVYDFDKPNYVYFDFDKASLKPRMQSFLNSIADTLSTNSLLSIRLEGHTDYKGSKTYNRKLGDRRAKSVKQFFLNKGVSKDKIVTVSYGETKPLLDAKVNGQDLPAIRALNRRVKIEIVSK